jgi:hypothetical protein
LEPQKVRWDSTTSRKPETYTEIYDAVIEPGFQKHTTILGIGIQSLGFWPISVFDTEGESALDP